MSTSSDVHVFGSLGTVSLEILRLEFITYLLFIIYYYDSLDRYLMNLLLCFTLYSVSVAVIQFNLPPSSTPVAIPIQVLFLFHPETRPRPFGFNPLGDCSTDLLFLFYPIHFLPYLSFINHHDQT